MTDPPTDPAPAGPPAGAPAGAPEDVAGDLVDDVLAQADELPGLDAARAEAWGSDVIALAVEALGDLEPLVSELAERAALDDAAALVLRTVAAVAPPGSVAVPRRIGLAPPFVAALGTSRCEGAWLLRAGPSRSVAFAFVDAHDDRHIVTADLEPGSGGDDEELGEVAVGPAEMLATAREAAHDGATIELVIEPASPEELAGRVVDAIGATARPRPSAVVNGHLLARRLEAILGVPVDAPVAVTEAPPEAPPRDPADDAHARSVLRGALTRSPGASVSGAFAVDDEATSRIDELADLVAPESLAPLSPRERDAVLILEWADWLGAVLGLVRAGPGARADGEALVDLVNRCPEVTSPIPKADRDRIAWAFDVVVEAWSELGVVDAAGALTEAGVGLLPAALDRAWSRSAP